MSKAKSIQKMAEKLLGKSGKSSKTKAAKRKKPTQEGVKFATKKDIKDGMPSRAEMQIDRERATARVAKGSRSEKMTVGRSSVANFIKDQMAASVGMQARSRQDKAFYKAIREAETEADKKKLREAHQKIRDKRAKADAKAETSRRVNISKGLRSRKKAEPDNFMIALRKAKETGELGEEYEKLTPNQQKQIVESAKRTLDVPDPDVSNRRLLMRKLGEMEANPPKKRNGSVDFRKGGMVISTKDNRKKR